MALDKREEDTLQKALNLLADQETDALNIFRPQRHQLPIFHSTARECLVQGGVRSGKSVCCAAKFASELTGRPIIGPDGELIYPKAPREKPLVAWVIGYGVKHIGQTFYRLLFTPQLKMIRDLETGKWRSFNPSDLSDIERQAKDHDKPRKEKSVQLAQPFIPKRLIAPKGWGWATRSIRHFEVCRLINGNVIYAFTSGGEDKRGDEVDFIWIDEEFEHPEHYSEWQSRTAGVKGRIFVSQWPGKGNIAVKALARRAELEMRKPPPWEVEHIKLKFSDNQYWDPVERARSKRAWLQQGGEQELRSRDEGELLNTEKRVYPGFSPWVQCCPALNPDKDDILDKIIRQNGLQPPMDWTVDVIVDPGHANPGALMCAIPPPELKYEGRTYRINAGIVYDELFCPEHSATELARRLYHKLKHRSVYRFIMDFKGGSQSLMGLGGVKTEHIYADAFKAAELRCETTGHHFQWSSSHWEADTQLVRERFMVDDTTGRPWLRIITENCTDLVKQLENYSRKQQRGPDGEMEIKDQPALHQIDPLCDCLRYWVASFPHYSKPKALAEKVSPAYAVYLEEEKERERDEDQTIYLGPPRAVA